MIFLFSQQSIAEVKACKNLLSANHPLVAQSLDYTCGPACFGSMMRHWNGSSPSEAQLAQALGTLEKQDTTNAMVIRLAQEYGFNSSEQTQTTVEELYRYLGNGESVFVGWWDGEVEHFSLLEGLGDGKITLMDPWEARQ